MSQMSGYRRAVRRGGLGIGLPGLGAAVAAVGLAVAASMLLVPAQARAQGAEVLTLTAPVQSAPSGTEVTFAGTLTDGGQPATSAAVDVTISSYTDGSSEAVTTSGTGTFSVPVTVDSTTTVTAVSEDGDSNDASVTVTAVASATLKLATATLPRPYLLDAATIDLAPAGLAESTLQVRPAGTTGWTTAPDGGGVWGTKAGQIQARVLVTAPGVAATGVSPVLTVTVRNGRIPAWLQQLNHVRTLNNARPVAENALWSHGDALHIRYMDHTGDFSHTEDPKSKWYTKLGAEAGESSDLLDGQVPNAVDFWARAPYHALSEEDRTATLAGFAATGGYSALWTSSVQPQLTYRGPDYQFPAAGKTAWLLNYVSGEIPDPLSTCPKAWRNRDNPLAATYTGLPIIYGTSGAIRKPTATVTTGRTSLRVCVVTAGIYGNAVFVIPLYPLRPHRSYTVTVKYAGKQQSCWTFKTRPSPSDEYNP
jgi:hypothetical protein